MPGQASRITWLLIGIRTEVTVLVLVREHDEGQVTRVACVVVGCVAAVVVVAVVECNRQEQTELASATMLA